MSRAYRIRVRESLSKVVRAHDQVSTQLELLEVLPREQMAELLSHELEDRGFPCEDHTAQRTRDGIEVSVDLDTGEVTVRIEASREVNVEGEKEGRAFDDMGPHADKVAKELRKDLRQ